MIEERNESQTKPGYEAPELLSLGETMRGIAMCYAGSTPSGGDDYCTKGYDAYEACAYGECAWEECTNGAGVR